MTRKLDLRTGRTVWQSYRAPTVPAEKLRRDIIVDVIVVGMGISGAMAADAVAATGRSVALIDRRGPVLGSTAATTALVQYEIDQPLSRLASSIGREKAERAWRRSRLAVANLAGHISQSGISCRAGLRPSLYLAGDVLDASAVEAEATARRQAGLGATFLSAKALRADFGLHRAAAIISEGNISLDPRKLTAGLLLRAAKRGARLFAPAEAVAVDHHAGGVDVVTRGGPVLKAAHIVLATGYELMDMVEAPRHQIISTYAIATRPQKTRLLPREPMVWEASDPYLYLRSTTDGRIICGGEDETFVDEDRRDAMIPDKTAIISDKLGRLLPGIDAKPEFSWAGSFGTTATGLPYIGALPRKPRIFSVLGYGGNGITYSRVASELIVTALDGRTDSDADLFAF